MTDFPMKQIGEWIYQECTSFKPDIIIPIGHRIFNLLLILKTESKEINDEVFKKVIDINALYYIDVNNKNILLIDEETEYGRKFIYDIFPRFQKTSPKNIRCLTVFLCDDEESKPMREDYLKKYITENPDKSVFASSLERIKAYRIIKDSKKFHSSIFLFRTFIKSKLNRPYNTDATIFHVDSDKNLELEEKFSKYGPLFSYNNTMHSLFPLFFDIKRFNDLEGIKINEDTLPKIRIYEDSEKSLLISPMIYSTVSYEINFTDLNWIHKIKNKFLLYKMIQSWSEHKQLELSNPDYLIQIYDLTVFWLDVELFKEFIRVLKKDGYGIT